MGDSSGTFSPFKHRIFLSLWLANLFSNLGGMIQAVGASWLMATMERSIEVVSLVQVANTLPVMLFALLGGAIADVFDRRMVMIANQILMLVVSIALALFSVAHALTPTLLLLFTFLIACGTALNSPAWQASVGHMVPRNDLPAAVSLNAVGYNIARSAGPAFGGLIVYASGPTATFALNAISYLGLIVMLLRWQRPKEANPLPRERIGSAMIAGVRYAAMSPNLINVLARGLCFGLAAAVLPALSPILARDALHSGPKGYGLLLASFGIGAVVGALLSARVRRLATAHRIVLLASLTFAVATSLLAISSALAWALPVVLVAGATWILALSTLNVSVQMSSPQWVKARASALHQMAAFGAMAVGSGLWGLLAERSGLTVALLTSAAFQAVTALVLTRLPLGDYSGIDVRPLDLWREPDLAVTLAPNAGPIAIIIEYQIVEADRTEFLNLMARRRQVRRRDGARQWSISRDLADPMLWIERFISPSWHDYVRQNQRAILADAEIGTSLRQLHRGTEPPMVRRSVEQRFPFHYDGDCG